MNLIKPFFRIMGALLFGILFTIFTGVVGIGDWIKYGLSWLFFGLYLELFLSSMMVMMMIDLIILF